MNHPTIQQTLAPPLPQPAVMTADTFTPDSEIQRAARLQENEDLCRNAAPGETKVVPTDPKRLSGSAVQPHGIYIPLPGILPITQSTINACLFPLDELQKAAKFENTIYPTLDRGDHPNPYPETNPNWDYVKVMKQKLQESKTF